MKTNLDEVIKTVAVRNGAGLKKSDAVMQLVTVMDVIIENHTTQLAEHQKILLVGFAEKIEESLLSINTDMKDNTKQSVNAVTEYAKDILPKVMTAGATEAVKAAKGELATMLLEFHNTVESFKQGVKIAVIMVVLSALGTGLAGVAQLIMEWKS